ncbi:MAG: hypothetical protein KDC49_04335 [Saprospiraceae bacterium]|nr:hypothetical protein [Saprospiraceae bacterium]
MQQNIFMSENQMNETDVPSSGIAWSVAASLLQSHKPSLGYAGMVGGIHNRVLILGGGANFPDAMPWEGGKKHYSDEIYVLGNLDGKYEWNEKNLSTLPEPIAYAGSATTDRGFVYAGGINENGISSKAFLLNWDEASQQVYCKPLPELLHAVSSPSMVASGSIVFLMCGEDENKASDKFYHLNLDSPILQWEVLPNVPLSLSHGAAVIQDQTIYLFGGRSKQTSGRSKLYQTSFAYDLENGVWHRLADISDGIQATPFTAGSAFAAGTEFVIMAGGDKGDVFSRIETLQSQIAETDNPTDKKLLIAEKNKLLIHHEGFSTDVFLYHIKTNHWSRLGNLPVASQLTGVANVWEGKLVLSSGEIRPGVRSPKVLMGEVSLEFLKPDKPEI